MLDQIKFKKKEYRSAVILCGGKGSRLGILSKKTAKTLVKIQKHSKDKHIRYFGVWSKIITCLAADDL